MFLSMLGRPHQFNKVNKFIYLFFKLLDQECLPILKPLKESFNESLEADDCVNRLLRIYNQIASLSMHSQYIKNDHFGFLLIIL